MNQIEKTRLIIGVSGNKGSFSELAAIDYVSRYAITADIRYLIDMKTVLQQLNDDQIDIGILPIINNNAGVVKQALNAMGEYPFEFKDSFSLQIDHCLMALPGVKKNKITAIVSHPQALKQCQQYLKRHYPSVEQKEWVDTAEAARMLSNHDLSQDVAVIAPKSSSDHYNLSVLDSTIQDNNPNLTTFIVILKNNCSEGLQTLPEMRENIDQIDKNIIRLLAKRNEICCRIGEYKHKHHINVCDTKRESALLKSHIQSAKLNNLNSTYIESLFQLIIAQSKQVQKND